MYIIDFDFTLAQRKSNKLFVRSAYLTNYNRVITILFTEA